MKACNQCEHYWAGFSSYRNRCSRPTDEISLITGEPIGIAESCYRERSKPFWWWQDRCGPDARYFEPKQLKEVGDGA